MVAPRASFLRHSSSGEIFAGRFSVTTAAAAPCAPPRAPPPSAAAARDEADAEEEEDADAEEEEEEDALATLTTANSWYVRWLATNFFTALGRSCSTYRPPRSKFAPAEFASP